MKEKKNLDRLFQEKFKEFEKEPPESVWQNIKRELTQEDERKILIPLWSKVVGVAALIALLFLVGRGLFFNDFGKQSPAVAPNNSSLTRGVDAHKTPKGIQPENKGSVTYENAENSADAETIRQNEIGTHKEKLNPSTNNNEAINTPAISQNATPVQTNKSTQDKSSDKSNIQQQKRSNLQSEIAVDDRSNRIEQTDADIDTKNEDTNPEHKTHIAEAEDKNVKNQQKYDRQEDYSPTTERNDELKSKNETLAAIKTTDKTSKTKGENTVGKLDSLKLKPSKKHSIYDDIAKNETDNASLKTTESDPKKLAVRPNIAPVYYNSLNGGSALDPVLSDNKTKGEVTMSFGVDVAYNLSEKFKIRSGINKVNMSYNTLGISYTMTTQANNLKGLSPNQNAKNMVVVNSARPQPKANGEVAEEYLMPYAEGSLNQQLEYLEVPFEVEYALLNHRFSINVIGGASTLFLTDNAVHLESYMGTANLGEANNLNSVSFTTNIGLGFGYNLTQSLNLNLEPTFKYQLNGYKGSTGGFDPYYFGIYTGMSFKF